MWTGDSCWGPFPTTPHSPSLKSCLLLCAGQLANTVLRDFFVTSKLPAVTPKPFWGKDYVLVERLEGQLILKEESCLHSLGRPATQLYSFCKNVRFQLARTHMKNTSIHKYSCIHEAGNKTLFSKCGGSTKNKCTNKNILSTQNFIFCESFFLT